MFPLASSDTSPLKTQRIVAQQSPTRPTMTEMHDAFRLVLVLANA
jgi:hypothetical protein